MRQVHHWTALVFLAAIVVHLARIFFTGAFRRPREINWLIGFGLLLLALGEGITGYSLPDDLLSGTGLRIVVLGRPLDPVRRTLGGVAALRRRVPDAPTFSAALFVFHVMLLPGLVIGTIAAHVGARVAAEAHPVPSGRPREDNVVGPPLLARPGVPVGRPVLPDRGGRRAPRRPRPDQPGLAVRPVRARRRHVARAARLVRRLARGRAPDLALPFEPTILGRDDPVAVRARASSSRACCSASSPSGRSSRPADPRPRRASPAGLAVGGALPRGDGRGDPRAVRSS